MHGVCTRGVQRDERVAALVVGGEAAVLLGDHRALTLRTHHDPGVGALLSRSLGSVQVRLHVTAPTAVPPNAQQAGPLQGPCAPVARVFERGHVNRLHARLGRLQRCDVDKVGQVRAAEAWGSNGVATTHDAVMVEWVAGDSHARAFDLIAARLACRARSQRGQRRA